jgi:hypothetical protein
MNAQNITATSAKMGGYTTTGSSQITTFMWTAIQMTPTSAAG